MYYTHHNNQLTGAHRVTTPNGNWDHTNHHTPPPGWIWAETEQEARQHYGIPEWDIQPTNLHETIDIIINELGETKVANTLTELWGHHVEGQTVPFHPVPHYGHGPGRHVTDNGQTYVNTSGAWLHHHPSLGNGWTNATPPTSPVDEWDPNATYKPGDLAARYGLVYKCLVGHGPEYQGTWGPPAPGVWEQTGSL